MRIHHPSNFIIYMCETVESLLLSIRQSCFCCIRVTVSKIPYAEKKLPVLSVNSSFIVL